MDTREEWLRELNPTDLDKELEEANKFICEHCWVVMTDHPKAENNKCFLDVDANIYFCPDCESYHESLGTEPVNIKVVFDANKP